MEVISPEGDVGIIIGRFQVPYLHEAHEDLIDTVSKKHKRVAVFLGVAVAQTRVNPLNFESRQQMIREKYPDVVVLPIADTKYDERWVDELERQIDMIFPTNKVVLYGSRDSFILCYKRVYAEGNKKQRRECVELRADVAISGTQLRKEAANSVVAHEAFRTGVIFASSNKFPSTFPTVDLAIVRRSLKKRPGVFQHDELLLAKRLSEKKYRFPGGFVDRRDSCFESAARREGFEETRGSFQDARYLGSAQIDDWRYRDTGDGIMTTLLEMPLLSGPSIAGDDVDEVRWFDFLDLSDDVVEPEHHVLMRMFVAAHATEIGTLRAGEARVKQWRHDE